jgi:hypothetical protein
MLVRIVVCALAVLVMAADGAGIAGVRGSDPRASAAHPLPSQDDVRSGFLISRRKKATPKRARPKAPVDGALGLGYTVFRRSPSGLPVRVGPAEELADGDEVRIVVEANEDGYLYVFNTDDRGASPVMIFPDARLDAGANRVRAHVPYELPSSRSHDAGLRWLHLADGPVTDRLHVIVTREPLAGVPSGEALVRLCESNAAECLWQPPSELWASLEAIPAPARRSAAGAMAGRRQSDVERSAIDRSVRLRPTAPAPSVVVQNHSPDAPRIAAVVAIPHR